MSVSIRKYAVTPLVLDHLLDVPWLPAETHDLLSFVAPHSQSWVGWQGDQVIAVGGVATVYAGVGEAWTYLCPTIDQHGMFLHRAVKSRLDLIKGQFRRVQSFAREDHAAACRWLERLGFHLESRMPLSGPNGETMCRYVCFPQEVPRG